MSAPGDPATGPLVARLGAARRFEALMGDPRRCTGPFGFAQAVAADDAQDPLDEAAARLAEAGFARQIVPADWDAGGELTDFEELLALARRLTARNLSLMPRVMYSIGPICALALAGTAEQRRRVASWAVEGSDVAFALSEPASRSDLLSGRLVAEKDGDGWRLTGNKWLIGRAIGGRGVLALAKTGPGGPAAFSLILVDRAGQEDRIVAGPRAALSGMRGIDVADLRLDGARAASSDLVGPEGMGIELTYRAQAPVKMLSVAATLGALETALRAAQDAAHERPGGAHAHQRRLLAEAFVDYLALDIGAVSAARVLSAAPRQFSVWASVVKQTAISLAGRVFDKAGMALGAASVLRQGHWAGIFQKMRRDAEIVRVIDINAVANLRHVATQLDGLAARRAQLGESGAAERLAGLVPALDLARPVGPMRLDRAQVVNMGGEHLSEALPAIRGALAADDRLGGEVRNMILEDVAAFEAALAGLTSDLAALRASASDYADRPELIAAAERFARIHAAANAAALWCANADPASPLFAPRFADGAWLALLLRRLRRGDAGWDDVPPAVFEGTWQTMKRIEDLGVVPSVLPVERAGT